MPGRIKVGLPGSRPKKAPLTENGDEAEEAKKAGRPGQGQDRSQWWLGPGRGKAMGAKPKSGRNR
jgi:hypothetical protein